MYDFLNEVPPIRPTLNNDHLFLVPMIVAFKGPDCICMCVCIYIHMHVCDLYLPFARVLASCVSINISVSGISLNFPRMTHFRKDYSISLKER